MMLTPSRYYRDNQMELLSDLMIFYDDRADLEANKPNIDVAEYKRQALKLRQECENHNKQLEELKERVDKPFPLSQKPNIQAFRVYEGKRSDLEDKIKRAEGKLSEIEIERRNRRVEHNRELNDLEK
jgi:hypothetical protein